jgi:hypothetical protein
MALLGKWNVTLVQIIKYGERFTLMSSFITIRTNVTTYGLILYVSRVFPIRTNVVSLYLFVLIAFCKHFALLPPYHAFQLKLNNQTKNKWITNSWFHSVKPQMSIAYQRRLWSNYPNLWSNNHGRVSWPWPNALAYCWISLTTSYLLVQPRRQCSPAPPGQARRSCNPFQWLTSK